MALDQVNEELNDAIQTYFPKRGRLSNFVYKVLTSLTVRLLKIRRSLFKGTRLANERIIEYAQVLQWINPKGNVLDIGCVSSRLPLQLASLGYEVYGVDLSDYGPISHPQFHFYKTDIFKWTPPVKFDVVVLLSTLEHIGLGAYGDKRSEGGDKRVVDLITSWLRPGGQILVSVPFGKKGETPKHRVYDLGGLEVLFPKSKFNWRHSQSFKRESGVWVPTSPEALQNITSPTLPVNGVIVLDLEVTS